MRRKHIQHARRHKLGLCAGDFADQIGITMDAVYRVESGRNRPALDVAPAWAAALGMTIEQAFPELVAPAPEVDGPGNPLMPKPSKSPAP